MSHIVYEIVEHDGGWAYKLDGVFSEPFPTRDEAFDRARMAAAEQQVAGETVRIEWEDEKGKWHEELSPGDDRPEAEVRA